VNESLGQYWVIQDDTSIVTMSGCTYSVTQSHMVAAQTVTHWLIHSLLEAEAFVAV